MPSSSRRALAFLALSLAACGGRTLEMPTAGADGGAAAATGSDSAGSEDGGASSTGSSGSGGSGSGNGYFPVCPNNAPQAGWSCETPNQGCAYVVLPSNDCVSFTCDASGHWVNSTPAGC
jgi:hypothetical protein